MKIPFLLLFVVIPMTTYLCCNCERRGAPAEDRADEAQREWVHLSSTKGDIPVPGPSNQQTASLVLDIDKDGLNDFVIAARKVGPSVLWFRRDQNGWTKFVIDSSYLRIEAGGAHHDIDGDGDLDIVFGADAGDNKVWWWENPYPDYQPNTYWKRHIIKNNGENKHHDELFGDFDGDGGVELAFWNQRAKALMLAEIPESPSQTEKPWAQRVIYRYEGDTQQEGLAKADIDGDGIEDIIGGGRWFKLQTDGAYSPVVIDDDMRFTRAAAGQLKPGGPPEIVFVPGDANGPLRIYNCIGNPSLPADWKLTQPLDTIVIHGHSLALVDINQDGQLDIFNAEMHTPGQGENALCRILYGDGNLHFRLEIISKGMGNHESRIADLDGDGDLDILTKPYTFDAPRLDIWLNTLKN